MNNVKATITRPEPVEQPEAEVTLVLPEKYAEYLKALLGKVHTDSALGAVSYKIYCALSEVATAPLVLRTLTRHGARIIEGMNALSDASERATW